VTRVNDLLFVKSLCINAVICRDLNDWLVLTVHS